jgi:23S rRNA (uridine2552-2'-O)-methyltransferase
MKRPGVKKNRWGDHFAQRAKKEKFPARSVYKLAEIQKKYRLIKKGDRVLDLGCYPGSWLIYAGDLTTDKGRVVGVDVKPIEIQLQPHIKTYSVDILKIDDTLLAALGHDFDVVLSDLAPATTGQKNVDAARSFELSRAALSIARRVLLPGGSFVCKIFQGEDFNAFSAAIRTSFKWQKIYKPRSSRKASKEIYVIGLGYHDTVSETVA